MMDTSRDTFMSASEKAKKLTYNLARVEQGGFFVPATEDEVTEVECLLAEPISDAVLVDNVLSFDIVSHEFLGTNAFPDAIECGQRKYDIGALGCNTSQEGQEVSAFGLLNGTLRGTDEDAGLCERNVLSYACEDYILDTDFYGKVSDLEFGPCDESQPGNLPLEMHSTGFGHRNRVAAELSIATIPVPESNSDQNAPLLEKMTIRELQKAFRSTFGRETSVKDKQWLKRHILFGLPNLVESNVSGLMECGTSPKENDSDMNVSSSSESSERISNSFTYVPREETNQMSHSLKRGWLSDGNFLTTIHAEVGKVGIDRLNFEDRKDVLVLRKRLRKPTRRYIEESSELKSKYCRRRFGTLTSSRRKFLRGAGIQEQKGHLKKTVNNLERNSGDGTNMRLSIMDRYSSKESFPADSQDDMSDDCVSIIRTEKSGSRRKHHRLWTLSEVMKLIEGVSQYGVGRWTEIKRLLFSSSAYRTSVDLKDKWRNLLRASCAQLESKREVEEGRKHALHAIPQSVLHRVSELARIYPYPRERKLKASHPTTTANKLSYTTPTAAPTLGTAGGGAPVSRSGRIVYRKSFT